MSFRSNVISAFALGLLIVASTAGSPATFAQDPLPSWNDGSTKQAIIDFVAKVSDKESDGFVPRSKRIAVFDNDGNLWSEQPMYFQAAFAFDRIKQIADQHPEWQTTEPFASVLKGDFKAALAGGKHALLELVVASHTGMTTDEFDKIVRKWARTARHPKTGRLYTEMVYQPMLELLDYLKANGFKNFIVSGGGIDFMRPWAPRVYGIPAERIIGSRVKTKFEIRDGMPVVVRLPEIGFIDDKEGKPVGIQQNIGQRPIFASGNSDGDFQMLQWTTAGDGPRFGLVLHHTDADREWAYDRESAIGRLDRGLDEGKKLGWTFVDMKEDWNQIYPPLGDEAEGDDAENNQSLAGEWLVEDIAGRGVVDRAETTIEFAGDGTVTGSTSVNRYTGKATVDGENLNFGPLAATRRAGPPALMDQEQRFFRAIETVASFEFTKPGIAVFKDARGKVVMRLSRR